MSSIIKATDRNAAIHPVAFNFNDMAEQADQYLGNVRTQAAEIVAQARQKAEAIRKQAEAEGHKAGQQAVEQIVRKQLATVLPALRQVVEDIQRAKQAWLTQWEKGAVHVAAAIAGRLLRKKLHNVPDITLTLVREALELAAGSSQLRIHLHPDDHKALEQDADMLAGELTGLASAEWIADPEVTRGSCRVETQFGIIDQQFESQLARIEEELT